MAQIQEEIKYEREIRLRQEKERAERNERYAVTY